MFEKICSMTAVSRGTSGRSGTLSSEKGFVLVIVLVLSAVALGLMTALIYMIASGTRVSGLQKRYKTALDAGDGGGSAFYQLIATRAEATSLASLASSFNAAGLSYSATTPVGCQGTALSGTVYHGLEAKLLTPSSSWDLTTCDTSLNINPGDPNTYDMKIQLGTDTKYNVYAKIVATTDGNTGGVTGLQTKGVVSANTGEVSVSPMPYLYAIEVVSENNTKIDERAKLSILYQY
jgi:hypothetical protein